MSDLVHEVVRDAGLRYAARRLIIAAEQGSSITDEARSVFERYAGTDEDREIILRHARSFALEAGVEEEIGVLVDQERRETDK
jgi:hypothetical protein